MYNNLIIGAGEIGHTISKIVQGLTFFHDEYKGFDYYNSFLTEEDNGIISNIDPNFYCEIIHICYPCKDQEEFIKVTNIYIKDFKPQAIFIHSTVPVGTTDKIIELNPNLTIIYSPVRGRHVTLPDHVRKFIKYFAPATEEDKDKIELINSIFPFIQNVIVTDSRDLELAKIMSTTYLGWNLLFEKEMFKVCEENGLNFDFVYKEFNQSYNEMCNDEVYPERFKRPIYDHMEGPIGGHCVIPNLELDDNFITKTMKEYFNNK